MIIYRDYTQNILVFTHKTLENDAEPLILYKIIYRHVNMSLYQIQFKNLLITNVIYVLRFVKILIQCCVIIVSRVLIVVFFLIRHHGNLKNIINRYNE